MLMSSAMGDGTAARQPSARYAFYPLLDADGRELDVQISNPDLSSPDFIWLQLQRDTSLINEIQTRIEQVNFDNVAGISVLNEGDAVAARFQDDMTWYRAVVRTVNREHRKALVEFVDFGNQQMTDWTGIRRLQLGLVTAYHRCALCCALHFTSEYTGPLLQPNIVKLFAGLMTHLVAKVAQWSIVVKGYDHKHNKHNIDLYALLEPEPLNTQQMKVCVNEMIRKRLHKLHPNLYPQHQARVASSSVPGQSVPNWPVSAPGVSVVAPFPTAAAPFATPAAAPSAQPAMSAPTAGVPLRARNPPSVLEQARHPRVEYIKIAPEHLLGKTHSVVLTLVTDASDMYVQLVSGTTHKDYKYRDTLLQTTNALNVECQAAAARGQGGLQRAELYVGMPVAVLFAVEQRWHRGLVQTIEAATVDVLFVDYGNTEKVELTHVQRLDAKYTAQLPALAVRVALNGATPPAGQTGWPANSGCGAKLETMLEHELFASVLSPLPDGRYLVDLYNMTLPSPNVLDWLVAAGVCAKSGSTTQTIGQAGQQQATAAANTAMARMTISPAPAAPAAPFVQQPVAVASSSAKSPGQQRASPGQSHHHVPASPAHHFEPAKLPIGTVSSKQALIVGDDCDLFVCQSIVHQQLLTAVIEQCSKFDASALPPVVRPLQTRAACMAFYAEDRHWYRAEVVSDKGPLGIEVLFVDFGNRAVCRDHEVRTAIQDKTLLNTPTLALSCAFNGIKAVKANWNEHNAGTFENLIENCAMKVVGYNAVDNLHLIEMTTPNGQALADVLVQQKWATYVNAAGGASAPAAPSSYSQPQPQPPEPPTQQQPAPPPPPPLNLISVGQFPPLRLPFEAIGDYLDVKLLEHSAGSDCAQLPVQILRGDEDRIDPTYSSQFYAAGYNALSLQSHSGPQPDDCVGVYLEAASEWRRGRVLAALRNGLYEVLLVEEGRVVECDGGCLFALNDHLRSLPVRVFPVCLVDVPAGTPLPENVLRHCLQTSTTLHIKGQNASTGLLECALLADCGLDRPYTDMNQVITGRARLPLLLTSSK